CEVRIGGKPTRDAQRKAGFFTVQAPALHRGKSYIINFRIRAPVAATGDGDLEFTRQIVKFIVPADVTVQRKGQGRGIAVLVRVKTSHRAARNISRNVAAGASGRQSHAPKRLENIRERFDGHPMELHVLPHGDIRNAASMALGEISDGARLMTAQEAVGN